ncbi:MAG: 16S rRNA (cytosine(1402)-N(4))-methyltransferase RsmH [Candidatus Levybacteria bacterium]|nr:16S rRNA (cytosine(1402)-N(4))-methyltransferase RsmH [Candidatus Levybacteria bacterium]MDZ4227816.1 16S rRNA (cytosine(1402)-N(4))-methyltransferase RsmH [Candidatus Levybacteria bacterium]
MSNFHKSVLLTEVLEGLRVKPNEKYIDATLGGGGHSFEILKLGGIVLGIDVDKDAVEYIEKNKKPENLTIARGNFREIDKIAPEHNFDKMAGIIFDLGVSSHQIDDPTRGFSFQNEGPLDMRMDQDLGVRALDLIKVLTKGELNDIFTEFGEESRSWAISSAIVRARSIKPIETTTDLAKIVFAIAGQSKKVFQALRIVINGELDSISEALPKALRLLKENGRLCVISFHSLEDRIVKRNFLEFEREGLGRIITERPIIPTGKEIEGNKRARSAKLRIFEKI